MNISDKISSLFQNYVVAFSQLNVEKVEHCYHIPCLLSTPEKVVLLDDKPLFEQEFKQIFSFLKENHINGFKASNSSYQQLTDDLVIVNIDWQFINNANNVIAEFSAIYHLTLVNNDFRIINVNSIDLSQSLSLKNQLILNVENI